MWPWSSASDEPFWRAENLLSAWPVDRPRNWRGLINEPMRETAADEVRTSIKRDRPLGEEAWVRRTCRRLGLLHTLNPTGRPKKTRK